jgi:hypothetical protein
MRNSGDANVPRESLLPLVAAAGGVGGAVGAGLGVAGALSLIFFLGLKSFYDGAKFIRRELVVIINHLLTGVKQLFKFVV